GAHHQIFRLPTAQYADVEDRVVGEIEGGGEVGKAIDPPAIHRVEDVALANTRLLRRAARGHVGDEHSPIARQPEARSQLRGDALRGDTDLDAVAVATLAQPGVAEAGDRCRAGAPLPPLPARPAR